MMRLAPLLMAVALALPSAAGAQETDGGVSPSDAARIADGRRIYREGILPSGERLVGVAQAAVQRTGLDAACGACHRRSGFGGSEGSIEIRPITGPALFGERDGRPAALPLEPSRRAESESAASRAPADGASLLRDARARLLSGGPRPPAYDEAGLRRAIRDGVDVVGRKLNPAMPRYALGDEDLDSLIAYLKTLSVHVSPGLTDDAVQFATVIQPGVEPTKRKALLDVLRGFFDDRNAQMRAEATRHPTRSTRVGRVFREWRLQVWELEGPSDTWAAQLEARHRTLPAFALISGLGTESWRPIHEFSERFEVPCVFPQTDLPLIDGPGIYTVYLSRGVILEAQALAKFLREQGDRGPVVQVSRPNGASGVAAAAFRDAQLAGTGVAPLEYQLDGVATAAFWHILEDESRGATLVLWLGESDLAAAPAWSEGLAAVKAVYLSSTMLAGGGAEGAEVPERRVRMIFPQDLPQARAARHEVVRRWLRKKDIALTDETVQWNAYLAVVVTAGAMAHSMDVLSRDYLLERVEHRVGNAMDPSMYPHLSLGPGQRFASKGSYIVRADGADRSSLEAVSGWIVP